MDWEGDWENIMSVQSQERGEEVGTTLFIFAMNDDGSADRIRERK